MVLCYGSLELYIDIRPPNLHKCDESDSPTRLVDYDDVVLLKGKPCCDYSTVCTMQKNEHMKKVLHLYKKLAELFDVASTADVCEVCAQERAKA